MKIQQELEEISIANILDVLLKQKLLIISFIGLCALASVFYVLSLPNMYLSTAKAISNKSSQGNLSSLAGSLGGLAGLAGVNLGAGDEKVQMAIELLKSREFLYQFTVKHQILVPLIAAEGLDDHKNLLINPKLYDKETNTWIREVFYPKPVIPSAEDVYLAFDEFLSVSNDVKTGVVTVSFEFYSPEIAQQWLTWLIKDVNEVIRLQDMEEARTSIEFLKKIAYKSESAAMKDTFFQLMEEQMKTLLLTEVRQDYILKNLDPANFPEIKSSPNRALICAVVTLLSCVIIVMFVLVRHFTYSHNNE